VRQTGAWCDVDETETADFGQWDYFEEVSDMTPEEAAILRDIQTQLRGPDLAGWPQLGKNAAGANLTLMEGLAAALAQIAELRTEITDLETTTAELGKQVQQSRPHWPWPFSLLTGPAALVGDQLTRLEALLNELLGRGPTETGHGTGTTEHRRPD
jgi:hypothetical protein